MTATRYAKGDRVVGADFLRRGKAGRIEKPAKESALVHWDGEGKPERVSLRSLTPETAEHIATRARIAALSAWRDTRPRTQIARVKYDSRWGHGDDELGAEVYQALTPEQMRIAADELRLLADWFEQRPKETP